MVAKKRASRPVRHAKSDTRAATTLKQGPKTTRSPSQVDEGEGFDKARILGPAPTFRHLPGWLQGQPGGFGGHQASFALERLARRAVMDEIGQLGVYKSATPFSTRTTSLAWHPTQPTLCAVGSKWGDILLWNYARDHFQNLESGRGPGGSILGLKFDVNSQCRLYTCSIDGQLAVRDFVGEQSQVFLRTDDWERWFSAFDVSPVGDTLIAGDNKGQVTLLTRDGEVVWESRLHPKKVTNLQFSPREPHLFISTSVDSSVKVWDIRHLKDKTSAMLTLVHDKPVNSAYFNPLDGTRLLTTDQHSQLRVFRAPNWQLERILPHPHRQFQHLTPIKATWHPLADIVVAGRYPHELFPDYQVGEPRSVDFLDPDSGKMLFQLTQPGMTNIISLNLFSPTGDAMLSGMASTVLVWKQRPPSTLEAKEQTIFQEKESNIENLMAQFVPTRLDMDFISQIQLDPVLQAKFLEQFY
eukprot:snap_masked-scaffold927_size80360-processed-gene-0.5 protein:Tk12207 transcript:snap_masked-scaffold927_size80360-processed-gene-0.5-mRNA-1 annotation:"dna damage-binding protein 2"